MYVVIVNDLGETHPVCESIMMGEQENLYVFLIQSTLKICPKVNPSDLKVVLEIIFYF